MASDKDFSVNHENRDAETQQGHQKNIFEGVSRRTVLGSTAVGLVALSGLAQAQTNHRQEFKPEVRELNFDTLSALPEKFSGNFDDAISFLQREKVDGVENPGDLAEVVEPIDVGADELLNEYKRSRLTYSPHQTEYLVETLAQHISACVDLRRQAQELEAQAIDTRLTLQFESDLNKLEELQTIFNSENLSRLLSFTVDSYVDKDTGQIKGVGQADDFYEVISTIERGLHTAKVNNTNLRQKYYEEIGSGANFVGRIRFLKQLFELELREAYQRARSIVTGLREYYEVDIPLPDPKQVGYLDDLTLWTRAIVYTLERELMGRDESVLTKPLVKRDSLDFGVMEPGDFNNQRTAGKFTFNLKQDLIDRSTVKITNPLLRGLSVAFVGTKRADANFWGSSTVHVDLGTEVLENDQGEQEYAVSRFASISPVGFLQQEQPVPSIRALHNLKPFGREWSLEIDTANTNGQNIRDDQTLKNLVLLLRVSHEHP